jgi:hypothetical protein
MTFVMGYWHGADRSASRRFAEPISYKTYARNPPNPHIYVLLEKTLHMFL